MDSLRLKKKTETECKSENVTENVSNDIDLILLTRGGRGWTQCVEKFRDINLICTPETPSAKANEQALMNAASLGEFKNAICLHEKEAFLHFYNESVKIEIFHPYPLTSDGLYEQHVGAVIDLLQGKSGRKDIFWINNIHTPQACSL